MQAIQIKLQREGHEVAAFLSGDEAKAAMEKSGPPDLLITDAVMPGETQGVDLIEFLRSTSPNVPAILMSGYAASEFGEGFDTDLPDRFLVKPIILTELSAAINELLVALPSSH